MSFSTPQQQNKFIGNSLFKNGIEAAGMQINMKPLSPKPLFDNMNLTNERLKTEIDYCTKKLGNVSQISGKNKKYNLKQNRCFRDELANIILDSQDGLAR